MNVIYIPGYVALILTVIMVTAKLAGNVTWSWWIVLAPAWLFAIYYLIIVAIVVWALTHFWTRD